jgi:hypothetical protein
LSDEGMGGLSLITNDGGSGGVLSFVSPANVTFANLSSSLSINGAAYTLVDRVKTLAADIALNPSGDFALAQSFDASNEGTFKGSAIPTTFTGTFEGLGNTIYDLAVYDKNTTEIFYIGMFAWIGPEGKLKI